MPELKTLVEDVYSLFDPDKDHECSEENLQVLADTIISLVRTRLKKQERDKDNSIRFSNLGKPDRVHWYKAKGVEGEKMSPKTYLKFMYGDVIESLLLFLIKESGHTVEDEQLEIELDGIKGHIDARIDGVICDIKSAAPYSYLKFEKGTLLDDDPFGYIPQLSGYDYVLEGKDSPTFIAFDKVGGDICTFSIPYEVTKQFDPSKRIAQLKEVVKQEEAPPRCYPDEPDGKSGNMKLGTQCSYCEFKKTCWKDANNGKGLYGYAYSSGPRWLTRVIKEPEVFKFDG